MRFRSVCSFLLLFPLFVLRGIAAEPMTTDNGKPRLVLAIVVDQMRADYIDRFRDLFGADGFNLLISRGARYTNCNYDHMPTNTAPGHSTFLSGIYLGTSGIVGNSWYDFSLGRSVYCVSDPAVHSVGTDSSSSAGMMSPRNFHGTTLGDWLKKISPSSKVIGIAIKDRGAILPAGQHPDGAYWFDTRSGNWISSSYYTPSLPQWVQSFNSRNIPESYLNRVWNKLLADSAYSRQHADDSPAEGTIPGETKPVFPHVVSDLSLPKFHSTRRFAAIPPTPFGNELTERFAEAAITGEHLGQDSVTDILSVSFSSPDYCGHTFGPNSQEIEDIYLRLDRQLADLLAFVDSTVGLNNTIVVLTGDHGVCPFPEEFPSSEAGRINPKEFLNAIKVRVGQQFNYNEENDNLIPTLINDWVYLDYKGIEAHGFNRQAFETAVGKACLQNRYISAYFTRSQIERSMASGGSKDPIQRKVEHGYNAERSGGVAFVTKPHCFLDSSPTGTEHGSGYEYDTHVPLLFCGFDITHTTIDAPCRPNDISATLADILGVPTDVKCAGKVLTDIEEK